MKVLFLVEAGGAYGLGHLMRSEVLADALSARGVQAVLGLRSDTGGMPAWRPAQFETIPVDDAASAESLGAAQRPGWVVVDGYGFLTEGVVARLRARGLRVLAFDDLGTEGGGADLVVNQNGLAMSMAPGRLLGPAYALVDPAYAEHRSRPIGESVRRVLITFGGSDLHGLTARTVAAFRDVPGSLVLDVVIGPYHRTRSFDGPGAHQLVLHQQPHGLAPLLGSVDLVISAAGSTCWQVCCAGIPLVAVQTADNQKEVVRALTDRGCALTFPLDAFDALLGSGGFHSIIDRLRVAAVRRDMSEAQQRLVDGKGAARIAAAMGV
ncbi:MAG TPA: hypothetical protein VHA77_14160 [Xanthobacteraceae bacterium]|nr:hypothetical protein [Xanthobacteraceae bacterium]